jgi:hypothetical protein
MFDVDSAPSACAVRTDSIRAASGEVYFRRIPAGAKWSIIPEVSRLQAWEGFGQAQEV